jgi:F-type H+-transporting ATPase subunit gamma
MAKARAIIKRRKAVTNIRKITRTMQLIATARFQAAYSRATKTRPYTERITELVRQLSRDQSDLSHPLLKVSSESKRSRLIVVTSNRGLCGGYNGSILRLAIEHLRAREAAGETVDIYAVGKKGISYLKFLGRTPAWTATHFEDKPQYVEVEPIASELIDAYERQQIDAVHVACMRFFSAGVQRPQVMQLLPIEPPQADAEAAAGAAAVQYDFSPPPAELLAELLPETVKVRLFQCFIDAAVSEQVARMVAMTSATDAAGDMIRTLTRHYNRARQSQITLELLDIVSGAEALR